ncbi:uncharacterized protein [Rutidosis leptorrhynchoides]|uniref:uncharacterized protein n=1 Tax=Rutidosis leptorrhynchoides TaxID=125765 RepID=UPI003A99E77E
MRYDNDDWVLCGDFNEVRQVEERRNCEFIQCRAKIFNNFIGKMGVFEVSLVGKKFTTICDNGLKFNKLDSFLISSSVLNKWNDLSVKVLDRKASYHCPLVLRSKTCDYGPKPYKVFNSWLNAKGTADIITSTWNLEVDSRRPDIRFRKTFKEC